MRYESCFVQSQTGKRRRFDTVTLSPRSFALAAQTAAGWSRGAILALTSAVLVNGLVCGVTNAGAAVHDLDDVRAAVRAFLVANVGGIESPEQVEVGIVDPRLRLAPCGQPLKVFFSAGGAGAGNTTVGVRCLGPSPWLIYVPGRVNVYRNVVVTTRAIPRRSVIGEADVRLERREVSNQTAGYLEAPQLAVGRVARRPMSIGSVIEPAALRNRRLVRRGERVTILADTGRLVVQMKGKALMDGASGERVRVENLSSGRIVEGTVTASGQIRVRH